MPPKFLCISLFACPNGVNNLLLKAFGIPIPVSSIYITRVPVVSLDTFADFAPSTLNDLVFAGLDILPPALVPFYAGFLWLHS